MLADSTDAVAMPSTAKSAVTNGSRLLRGDQRGPSARRYRDLVERFGAEAGGFRNLPETGQQLVRRLASLTAVLEEMEAASIAGHAVDPVVFVTSVNTQRRLLRDLERLKTTIIGPGKPSLADHLAANYPGNAGKAA